MLDDSSLKTCSIVKNIFFLDFIARLLHIFLINLHFYPNTGVFSYQLTRYNNLKRVNCLGSSLY